MAYKAPDISSYQDDIDIKALASQVDFFIFRAYAGISKDKKVERNVLQKKNFVEVVVRIKKRCTFAARNQRE